MKAIFVDREPINLQEAHDSEVLARSFVEPEAFAEIVNRYQRLFLRKAREITGSDEDAADIVQETFVRIYAAGKRFKPLHNTSFKSWAYTILVRQCYTLYRREKRRASLVVPLDPEFADVIPDVVEREAREHAFSVENALTLISQLPAKLKRVVELYFIDGMRYREIAIREKLSPVAVRARIHRAKKELRRLHTASLV